MRIIKSVASAFALTLLVAAPALAGGDYDHRRSPYAREYYRGLPDDRPFYDGHYYRAPGYARGPFPVPYVWSYGYNYGLNPGYRFSRVVYVYPGRFRGDCVVGRRGRLYCD